MVRQTAPRDEGRVSTFDAFRCFCNSSGVYDMVPWCAPSCWEDLSLVYGLMINGGCHASPRSPASLLSEAVKLQGLGDLRSHGRVGGLTED